MTLRAALWYTCVTGALCIVFLIIGFSISQHTAVKIDSARVATIDSLTTRCTWYESTVVAKQDSILMILRRWEGNKATDAQKARAKAMSAGVKP